MNSHFLWMDLSQPDSLNIPGIPFGIPVLAIIVVITTYMQSRLMTPPSTGDQQSSMMMGMMNIYMPFLMGWIALTLASGLGIYFVTSNVVGIAQYAILGKVNWSNLIPGRKSTPPPSSKKTPVISKSEPEPEPKSRPVLSAKNSKESVKATKTVKATKPVSKPTKINPKPKS